jgi:ATP-binding cassette subfamily B protein
VLLIVPAVIVPILVLGAGCALLSRENQDWIAASSGNASEALLSVQTVQAFTHERRQPRRLSRRDRGKLRQRRRRITTRAAMTVIVIFLVFSGIVGVLWIGARDVRAGADDRARWCSS